MRLADGEPAAGPWRVIALAAFAELVLEAAGPVTGRGRIIAVDGRSAGGKTTLARRLAAAIPGAGTVHTDDVAWWHSYFDWADLMRTGVLEPLHRGEAVTFRPPAWDARGRPGTIEVRAAAPAVIVEGVGAGRTETADLVDAVLWVQSDLDVRAARDAARVAAGEVAPELLESWMAEEFPFQAAQRPWERAVAVVAGTPEEPHDPEAEVVVAPGPPDGDAAGRDGSHQAACGAKG